MYKKTGLYYRTIRHLTPRQVLFQVWHRLRGRPRLRWSALPPDHVPAPAYPTTFTFLNQPVTFNNAIDWNYAANGKLWTYNLNYFDWLRDNPPPERGLALMYDFIRQTPQLLDGLEPYPISLRVVNWQRFLRQQPGRHPLIERHLYAQTTLLRSRLEYHLGGNHLLENACALLIMAVYFRQRTWYRVGANLLRAELAEQILSDGGHYERSPVYHQLLTDRLLDVYDVLTEAVGWADPGLTELVARKTGLMLGWLRAVTFRNGTVPMVNDAAYGVAPTTAQLLQKATYLKLSPTPVPLGDSGYRMLTTARLECFVDVGPVGPDHQPGHAHADTLSFVLHVDQAPLLVDVGTSTYQAGERRDWERSTAAHNTVTVADQNSSEVWGGFRVGRRAGVELLCDQPDCVEARHRGYAALGVVHSRRWALVDEHTLEVLDRLSDQNIIKKHRLFMQAGLSLNEQAGPIQVNKLLIRFASADPVATQVGTYLQPAGFNQYTSAPVITTQFRQCLRTILTVTK